MKRNIKAIAELVRAGIASEQDMADLGADNLLSIKSDGEHAHYRFFAMDDGVDVGASLRDVEEITARAASTEDDARVKRNDVVSTEHVDRMGDIIRQKGLDLTHYKKNPTVLYGHDSGSAFGGNSAASLTAGLPIGTAKGLRRAKLADGVLATLSDTHFFPVGVNPKGDLVYQIVQAGGLPGRSIGFIPHDLYVPESEEERTKLGLGRFGFDIRKSEQLEYSVVPVPANAHALGEKAIKAARAVLDEFGRQSAGAKQLAAEVWSELPVTEARWFEIRRAKARSRIVVPAMPKAAPAAEDELELEQPAALEPPAEQPVADTRAHEGAEEHAGLEHLEPDEYEQLELHLTAAGLTELARALDSLVRSHTLLIERFEALEQSHKAISDALRTAAHSPDHLADTSRGGCEAGNGPPRNPDETSEGPGEDFYSEALAYVRKKPIKTALRVPPVS